MAVDKILSGETVIRQRISAKSIFLSCVVLDDLIHSKREEILDIEKIFPNIIREN